MKLFLYIYLVAFVILVASMVAWSSTEISRKAIWVPVIPKSTSTVTVDVEILNAEYREKTSNPYR